MISVVFVRYFCYHSLLLLDGFFLFSQRYLNFDQNRSFYWKFTQIVINYNSNFISNI